MVATLPPTLLVQPGQAPLQRKKAARPRRTDLLRSRRMIVGENLFVEMSWQAGCALSLRPITDELGGLWPADPVPVLSCQLDSSYARHIMLGV